MLSRLAAVQTKSLNSQRGVLLAEIAVTALCLIGICTAVFLSTDRLQSCYYKNQVRLAANLLAADIRELQQETIFTSAKSTKTLTVASNDKQAYSVYNNVTGSTLDKRVSFIELGYQDVYFSQFLKSTSFYQNGSPKTSGKYLLRHKKLDKFFCQLSLQPVTGRVTVTENEG